MSGAILASVRRNPHSLTQGVPEADPEVGQNPPHGSPNGYVPSPPKDAQGIEVDRPGPDRPTLKR
jgi:hypothetical protein